MHNPFRTNHYSVARVLIATFITVAATTQLRAASSDLDSRIQAAQGEYRIVFVGNTLIAHMEKWAHLESALTARWPNREVSFRNLGWPADDVYGTARSEFGSARNTRSWQPPKEIEENLGYETLLTQVRNSNPSCVLVGYGTNAAFDTAPEALKRFSSGLNRLLDALAASCEHLILSTPPKHEMTSLPRVVTDENNRLEEIAQIIRDIGQERGYQVIDLFKNLIVPETSEQLTENGIHLNERGYKKLARLITSNLQTDLDWNVVISAEGTAAKSVGTQLTKLQSDANRIRFELKDKTLPSAINGAGRRLSVKGLPAGTGYRLKIDGHESLSASAEKWAEGIKILAGPEFDQVAQLRNRIIRKNNFYRQMLRPLNKAYIFLFRRHEMGHLAHEVDDLVRFTEEQDEQIAYLKIPHPHRYEIERITPWTPPRAYPDHEVPGRIQAPDIAAELAAFDISEEFSINIFASNPMIANPINANWDSRGRLWVSTSTTYPHIKPGHIPNDRIVILEDTDKDGRADQSTVFAEGLLIPQSIMPVPGGAYVCSATEFIHLIDRDGDDHADERRVIYAGFGNADVHHMIHGLRWSPWGELYFTQSIYINSYVETAWGPRRLNGSGIWRFRPETERLEVFARGMVNPWGHTFDAWGQSFATDGAGGRGVHTPFPGAAFASAVGADRVLAGLNPGKPKATAAVFLTGGHWPDSHAGSFLLNDYRANRVVRYSISNQGSGYAAEEVETLVRSRHRSFRPVDLKIGPDGALYIVDWYNPIIDHGEVDFHHPLRDRAHGRIWRLTAKQRPLVRPPHIFGASIEELLEALGQPEQWTQDAARRELAGRDKDHVLTSLESWLRGLDPEESDFDRLRLEALWLHACFREQNSLLQRDTLNSRDPRIRAAAVRVLATTFPNSPDAMEQLATAVRDEHPQVRLEAVNALRDQGTLSAAELAMSALDHPVDSNLDYALWLTARTTQDLWLPEMRAGRIVFDGHSDRLVFALQSANQAEAIRPLLDLVRKDQLSKNNRNTAIKLIANLGNQDDLSSLLTWAMQTRNAEALDTLSTINDARAPANAELVLRYLNDPDTAMRRAVLKLAGDWQLNKAQPSLRSRASSPNLHAEERLAAAQGLASLGDTSFLLSLSDPDQTTNVRLTALNALASRDPLSAAPVAVSILAQVDGNDAAPLFQAFIDHSQGPGALFSALRNHTLPAEVAKRAVQIAQASGRDLSELVEQLQVSGELEDADNITDSIDVDQLLAQIQSGDKNRGAKIYQRAEVACVACHSLNGIGGKVGPDLGSIGAFMTSAGILQSILEPNAAIKQGYETVLATLKDGEILSGTLQRKTETEALIRDATGAIQAVPLTEVETLDTSAISLMPPGLTGNLTSDETRDLISYLISLGR